MAFSVAKPRSISPSLYSKSRFGPGKSAGGNWSGGGPYPDYPPPPDYPDVNLGADDGNQGPELVGQRPTGVVSDKISRPSLFGDFGTRIGDAMTGAANVRSSDPFIAFAQGFSGERAAKAQRENLAYDRGVAADDRAYSRSLDKQKMDLEGRRVDAYEQATGAKAKPLVDENGAITADGQKFLIQEDIAYEKQLISSIGLSGQGNLTDPATMDTIHKMVAAHHAENAHRLTTGDPIPDVSGNATKDADAAPDAADAGSSIFDSLAPEGGATGLLSRMGKNAAADLQGAGNSLLDAIDSGVDRLAAGASGGQPAAAAAQPPVVPPIAPPTPITPPAAGAPGVAQPASVAPAAPAGAGGGTDAAYTKARALLARGVPRAEVEQALTQMGVDPSGL